MTAIPTFPAGHLPSPDEFTFMNPLRAYKAADTSRSSTSTLANDPDLFVTPIVNAVYAVQLFLMVQGGTVGDMKVDFTFPAGATFPWGFIAYDNGITGAPAAVNAIAFGAPTSGSSFFNVGLTGAGSQNTVPVYGLLTMGSTAGNLTLQWAQSTSDGTAATIKAGSWMRAERMA